MGKGSQLKKATSELETNKQKNDIFGRILLNTI